MKKLFIGIILILSIIINVNTIFAEELYGVVKKINSNYANPSFIIKEKHFKTILQAIKSDPELKNCISILEVDGRYIICPKEKIWKINNDYYLFENSMLQTAANSSKYSIGADGKLISNRSSNAAAGASNFKYNSTVSGADQNVLSNIITTLGKSFAEFGYKQKDNYFQFSYDNISWSSRPDCSGFASTIAAVYGLKKGVYNYTDGIVTNNSDNFATGVEPTGKLQSCMTKISIPTSVNELQMGDVIVIGRGGQGKHTIVFYKIQNGNAVFYHKTDEGDGTNKKPINIPLSQITSSNGIITFNNAALNSLNLNASLGGEVIKVYRLK